MYYLKLNIDYSDDPIKPPLLSNIISIDNAWKNSKIINMYSILKTQKFSRIVFVCHFV